jgi:5-methyltetrahydrofolate--homocysteine methyltransferase
LNIEAPEVVQGVHAAYIEAGAEAILTNTLGGSSVKLARSGLGGEASSLNRAAAELARQVAGEGVLVAGSMGPLGELLEPLGKVSRQEAVEAFAQQAAALAEGEVDIILAETMYDLREARAAVEGAKQATDLPILCTLAFEANLRTMMGDTPAQAVEELAGMGVAALGANCGSPGLEGTAEVLSAMREVRPQALYLVKPNAGLPQVVEGETVFPATPEEMARFALRYVRLGATMVGGCCGTTPAHILAMAQALGKR